MTALVCKNRLRLRPLGATLSDVRREAETIESFYDDPITLAYGVGGMFGADVTQRAADRADAIVRADGYDSLDEFLDVVEARTSAKWIYFNSGVLALGEPTRTGRTDR